MTIRIGVVGCGHWGANYLRNLDMMDETVPVIACDQRKPILEKIRKQYHGIEVSTEFSAVVNRDDLDAVIIATPAHTHYEFAKASILAGKHVLVEKPLALSTQECRELVEMASASKRVLMVGHTFLYNPGIRKMKEYLDKGTIGDIYYLQAVRTHLGLIRSDVNTVWDLAPHDISIFSYLLGRDPVKVSAVGVSPLKQALEDVAFINLFYGDDILGHIHISWIDANKCRQVAVIGSKARILFDDLNPLERVRIYEKGVSIDRSYNSFGEFQMLLRDGDIISPKIEPEEPLRNLCLEFVECIREGKKPLADGVNGMRVVETMCAIQKSIKNNGKPINLKEIRDENYSHRPSV